MKSTQVLKGVQDMINLIVDSIILALTVATFIESLNPQLKARIDAYLTGNGSDLNATGANLINLALLLIATFALSLIFSLIFQKSFAKLLQSFFVIVGVIGVIYQFGIEFAFIPFYIELRILTFDSILLIFISKFIDLRLAGLVSLLILFIFVVLISRQYHLDYTKPSNWPRIAFRKATANLVTFVGLLTLIDLILPTVTPFSGIFIDTPYTFFGLFVVFFLWEWPLALHKIHIEISTKEKLIREIRDEISKQGNLITLQPIDMSRIQYIQTEEAKRMRTISGSYGIPYAIVSFAIERLAGDYIDPRQR